LAESELFGHEKGAFTGAQARHLGYAERAGQGVLFLDEVGDLAPKLQGRLLRVIEERSLHRVGGEQAIPFKARLICATNSDLRGRIRTGSLYGAFLVKGFQRHSSFSSSVSLFDPESPFLRPDPQILDAVARRGCQGWPSRQRCHALNHRQATP
jgi:hypothetical protein